MAMKLGELETPYMRGHDMNLLGLPVCEIKDANGVYVLECFQDDADEIIKRINGYEQLQATNKQLLEALERGYNRLDKRGADAQNASSVKSILKEAITNAKQMGDKG